MSAGGPPSRRELEQGLRALHLAIADLRDDLTALAAQVIATAEVTAGTTDAAPAIDARAAVLRGELALADALAPGRVRLADIDDKYAATSPPIPCAELLPLCGARCCTFAFPLSSQDLDEGVVRWDHANPYLIRQRDGRCGHFADGCTIYPQRPRTCRVFDCRDDRRIWQDYAARIPAPPAPPGDASAGVDVTREALVARVRARQRALLFEASSLRSGTANDDDDT